MADELCRVEPVDICETEVTKQYLLLIFKVTFVPTFQVRLKCDIGMERRCRYIEGSSPEVGWTRYRRINFFQGSEKCASLRAQGIDCLPHLDPVFGGREEVEGEIVQIFEVCEEVPLMERSCEGEVSPFSLAIFCILFHQTGVSRCSSHWKKMWWTRSYNLSGCCPVWSELPTGDST